MSPPRVATAGDGAGQARPELLVVVEPALEAGSERDVLGAEAARIAGAIGADVRAITWPADASADFASVANALAELVSARRPAAVVLLDTDASRQIAPMVAHRCGSGAVLGCSDVTVHGGEVVHGESPPPVLSFSKPVYGGWLDEEIAATAGAAPVVTLDLVGIEPAGAYGEEVLAEAEMLDLGAVAPAMVRHLETIPPDPRSVDLVHARRIVTVGAGVESEELLDAVRELADLLGGSVGATRPVTDDGRLPKERLVGQTGRTVTPDLYVALGVSGSPHHVAGVRSADHILAVNRDVRAPVFQFSDVGYVADLEVVLPALVRRINQWRDESADV